jgi:hypothetical protein
MSRKEKAAPEGTGTDQSAAFSADHSTSTIPHWLVSLPTTAACIASLGAPIVTALVGLIEGGAR